MTDEERKNDLICDVPVPLHRRRREHLKSVKSASMASHVPRVHLYRHAGFPLQENPGVPVLAPYGFNMGGGSDIMHLLHSRLASLPQAPPDAAEIFFAFLQPYRPPFHAWTEADHARIRGMGPEREDYMPNSFRLTLITMCEQIRNGTFIRALMPHLKRSTLRRHALITPFEPGACWNEQRFQSPGGFLSKPVPMWVSRTIFEMTFDNFAAKEDLHGRPQRRVEMPYISSVRWDPKWEASGHVPPWKAPADAPPRRSLLACFTGTLRGRPESIRMRTILVEQCNGAASKTVCHTLLDGNFPIAPPSETAADDHQTVVLRKALKLKRRSTFCLEPPGFSPPRKSIVDSILSGCIPVLFYPKADYAVYMPWFYGGWGANASVRLDQSELLGGRLDVMKILAAVPMQEVRRMQAALAANAHKLVYGLGASGVPGDAVETLLRLIAAR